MSKKSRRITYSNLLNTFVNTHGQGDVKIEYSVFWLHNQYLILMEATSLVCGLVVATPWDTPVDTCQCCQCSWPGRDKIEKTNSAPWGNQFDESLELEASLHLEVHRYIRGNAVNTHGQGEVKSSRHTPYLIWLEATKLMNLWSWRRRYTLRSTGIYMAMLSISMARAR